MSCKGNNSMSLDSKSQNIERTISETSPKVSVVMATYRRNQSLEKALHSIIAQTYSNIEVIVVDDNADSKWNAEVEVIINNLRSHDFDMKYIKNACNKGSAEARNIGIREASGEYITFLDDDDLYLPDKVKNQVAYMIEKGLDYSITDLWLYDEEDRLIEKRTRDYIKDCSSTSLLKYHLLHHITGTDTMMFKREYLVYIGMFSPIDVGDEFYLMIKAIDGKGSFGYLPTCGVKAYVHTKSDGLSSGDGKIIGENQLYNYKKKYFNLLSFSEKRYVTMRHYAVLAFAEVRRKKYLNFFLHALLSFLVSPLACISLLIKRKK